MSPVTTTLPEPTHAEVIRRLDAIATDLKSLNDRLDSTYVRRDVHEEVHRNTETALAAKADREVVDAYLRGGSTVRGLAAELGVSRGTAHTRLLGVTDPDERKRAGV